MTGHREQLVGDGQGSLLGGAWTYITLLALLSCLNLIDWGNGAAEM